MNEENRSKEQSEEQPKGEADFSNPFLTNKIKFIPNVDPSNNLLQLTIISICTFLGIVLFRTYSILIGKDQGQISSKILDFFNGGMIGMFIGLIISGIIIGVRGD